MKLELDIILDASVKNWNQIKSFNATNWEVMTLCGKYKNKLKLYWRINDRTDDPLYFISRFIGDYIFYHFSKHWKDSRLTMHIVEVTLTWKKRIELAIAIQVNPSATSCKVRYLYYSKSTKSLKKSIMGNCHRGISFLVLGNSKILDS